MKKTYDIIVLGGGSAGFAAGRVAASEGVSTAVVEGGRETAGLCILRGCMPTKALLESSHRFHEMGRAAEFGLQAKTCRADWGKIVKRKNALVSDFAQYRIKQQENGKFDFIRGNARFVDSETVEVALLEDPKRGKTSNVRLRAKAFIVATGSEVALREIPGLRETGFITSDEALFRTRPYRTLTVLGGGAVALELAQYFAHLGVKVNLIQRSPHVLSTGDPDVAEVLENVFRREGMKVFTGTRLLKFEKKGKNKIAVFEQGKVRRRVAAEEILFALGRRPRTSQLNLEAAGVRTEGPRIAAAPTQQTSRKHIFAAGDVCGPYEIVHMGIEQGEIAARNAVAFLRGSRKRELMDYRLKLSVVFTRPEVATLGMSEKELRDAGKAYEVASYPFDDHGKSMVMGATDGFVKILAEPKQGRLLGAKIVGPNASDLIHELMACMYYKGTAAELASMPHYHPTLSEILTYPAEELAE